MQDLPIPDLLIRGGRVIDPASGLDDVADVAVVGTRIVAIEPSIDPTGVPEVIDASNLIVAPGLVDLHVHAYHGVNAYGVDVDPICQSTGVTTAVDAGSSGPVNFAGFKRFVVQSSRTRLLGFVAIAQHGVTRTPGDLVFPELADAKGAARVVAKNLDVCVGIKVRLAQDKITGDGRYALDLALEAGEACGRPIMVHIGETPLALEEIVAALRPGDIITHCFTPLTPSITGSDGKLRDNILEGQRRGVIFDVAHAGGHFSWDVARQSLEGGLVPNSLSTDVHGRTNPKEHGFLLPDVMSKFLALGLAVSDVIRLTTLAPAKILGWQDRIGVLAPGREADIALLALERGPVTLRDTEGVDLVVDERLTARATIRSGHIYRSQTN